MKGIKQKQNRKLTTVQWLKLCFLLLYFWTRQMYYTLRLMEQTNFLLEYMSKKDLHHIRSHIIHSKNIIFNTLRVFFFCLFVLIKCAWNSYHLKKHMKTDMKEALYVCITFFVCFLYPSPYTYGHSQHVTIFFFGFLFSFLNFYPNTLFP